MASNKIDLELKIKTAQESINELKKQNGIESGSKVDQQIKDIVTELQSLSKIASPTIGNLSRFNTLFNKLSEILINIAYSVGNVSSTFKELQQQLKEQEDIQEDWRSKIGGIKKQGRINKDTGRYELFDTYQSEVITNANIINSKGRQVKQSATFFKKFDASGKVISSEFKNPQAAQQVYDQLKKTEQENAKSLKDFSDELEKTTKKIAEINASLTAQSASGNNAIAAKILKDKIGVNRDTEAAKEFIHNQQDLNKTTSAIGQLNASIANQQTALNKAFKQFTIYALILRTAKKGLREAIKTIQDLDKELTEQAMVTGMTREQTYGLMKTYQELALATGATTKEVASVATEYIKQGKSIKDATVLTEAAVSAAKVARVSVSDSVNYLTTALNGFQLAASDAMLVSDKFAAVAASSATDYDELAIALSKVASQANLAGMSIDYTTALLTKGLETTREAPETMGTALKTIIARMRELSDYGETLEGDTDINNVEQQLAYVDIALRNTQGELRSTEDVLDELGRKWDTLTTNQQAAIAKALAGTRQQSRLIAMMSDYERVVELQQIAQQSAGATAAQAEVYLEGLEAKLNKITVAWEKITTTIVNHDLVIGFFEFVGDFLDKINDGLNSSLGQIVLMPALILTIGTAITGLIAKKQVENQIVKEQLELNRQQQIVKLQERNQLLLETELKQDGLNIDDASVRAAIAEYNALKAQGKQIIANNKAKKEKHTSSRSTAARGAGDSDIKVAQKEQKKYQSTLDQVNSAEQKLLETNKEYKLNQEAINALQARSNKLMNAGYLVLAARNAVEGVGNVIGTVKNLIKAKSIAADIKANNLSKEKIALTYGEVAANAAAIAAEQGKTISTWALVKAQLAVLGSNPWTWAILGVAVAGIIAMTALIDKQADSTENAAEKNQKLANSIYKSTQNAQKITTIIKQYDRLDKQILHTKEDLDEMNSLLEQGAELLDTENTNWHNQGKTEQEWYNGLDKASKAVYLQEKATEELSKAEADREEQLKNINRHQELLVKGNKYYAETKANLIALNNSQLYSELENLSLTQEQMQAYQTLGEQIFGNLDATELLDAANQNAAKSFTKLLTTLPKVQTAIGDVSAAEVLASDDYSLREKVDAYRDLANVLSGDVKNSFEDLYSEFKYFTKLGDETLKLLEDMSIGTQELITLSKEWSSLQKAGITISEEEYSKLLTDQLLPVLTETGGNLSATIDAVFGSYLTQVSDYEKAYNAIVNSFAKIIATGMLNMGQNIEKLNNSVNSFYKTASGWNGLTESEKTEFLQDNMDLFSTGGQELLAAFESGNYKAIEQALKENKGYQERLTKQLDEINRELLVEEQRVGDDRNEAYIKYLKEWKQKIQDPIEMFRADLDVLIKQEQKQLDIYKEYLSKQQEELENSLEKRKEAYESYFDAINEQQDDIDYEEERSRLVTNISKLATSTDANSQKQMVDLENQLMELEKERQQTLRERAQDALLEGLDKNVEDINSKFDKLLNNEGLLLQAMKQDLKTNPNILSDILYSAVANGQMTALNAEQYIQDLVSAFASTGVDTSGMKEAMTAIQNNATFNLSNGQTVNLDSDAAAELWLAIQSILIKKGYGN